VKRSYKERLQTVRDGRQTEKLQMLWWIQSGQVSEQQEISKRLGRNTSTITRWLQSYRQAGLAALLQVKTAPGATRKMSDAVIAALQQRLASEEGFSSYTAIVEWLKPEHGQTVKYSTVYQWVRYRLGAKLKVSRPQSYKQDEEAVAASKKPRGYPAESGDALDTRKVFPLPLSGRNSGGDENRDGQSHYRQRGKTNC